MTPGSEDEDDFDPVQPEAGTERQRLERNLIQLYYLRADLAEHDAAAALSLGLAIDIMIEAIEDCRRDTRL